MTTNKIGPIPKRDRERGETKLLVYLIVFIGIWLVGGYIYGCIQKEKLRRMGIGVEQKQQEFKPEYQGPPETRVEIPL